MTVKKLFIGGLRENVTEDDLKSYFSQYGSILEVVIIKEKDTSKSRGFGFVTFDDYDPIDKIICMISIFKKTFMIILITCVNLVEKHHTINGICIQTKKAIPRHKNKPIEFNNHS
jgi:RNA recognition motif-containing protein